MIIFTNEQCDSAFSLYTLKKKLCKIYFETIFTQKLLVNIKKQVTQKIKFCSKKTEMVSSCKTHSNNLYY